MTPEAIADYRRRCEAFASAGCLDSKMGLWLLEEVDRLRAIVEGLAERVAKQSELLSRKAEAAGGDTTEGAEV